MCHQPCASQGHLQPTEWIPIPTRAPGLQDGVHCPRMGYMAPRMGCIAQVGVPGLKDGSTVRGMGSMAQDGVDGPQDRAHGPGWDRWPPG